MADTFHWDMVPDQGCPVGKRVQPDTDSQLAEGLYYLRGSTTQHRKAHLEAVYHSQNNTALLYMVNSLSHFH